MRPVDKGAIPHDEHGLPIRINRYQLSRGYLIERLGSYCSYCERFLGGSIHVEHIQPKSKVTGLELNWNNFLLACGNCNSIKSSKTINVSNFFWPDQDNTARALEYKDGGLVQPSSDLPHNLFLIAKNTLNLTGLNRIPSDDPSVNPEMSDMRWRERRIALEKAKRAKGNLKTMDTVQLRDQIVDTATSTGFFSVWMTVFKHDHDMMWRLLHAFPGTSKGSYDENCSPIQRKGGQI